MRRGARFGVVLVFLAGFGCGGGEKGQSAGGSARSGGEKTTFEIKDYAFKPLSVKTGTAIEVANKDAENHTMTADDKAFDWNVDANGSATFTAPAEGTYAYACTNHPTMKGTLTVT